MISEHIYPSWAKKTQTGTHFTQIILSKQVIFLAPNGFSVDFLFGLARVGTGFAWHVRRVVLVMQREDRQTYICFDVDFRVPIRGIAEIENEPIDYNGCDSAQLCSRKPHFWFTLKSWKVTHAFPRYVK